MKKLIMLSGYRGSGKDTIADYLVREHNFVKFTIAKTMKKSAAKEYKIPLYYFYNQELKEKPLMDLPVETTDKFTRTIHKLLFKELPMVNCVKYWSPRALAILEGSVKRSVDSNHWVKKVMKEMEGDGVYYKPELCTISDLRYCSEVEAFKEKYGKNLITVRINRFDTIDTEEASERDLDNYKFDYVVENKGTLEDLYKKIDELLRSS